MDNINAFIGGLPVFILSMTVVFLMLGLLILFITLLSKILGLFVKKEDKKQEEPVQRQEENVTEDTSATDDLELVAVITAAIAASIGTTSDQLQVKSLRKVQRKAL